MKHSEQINDIAKALSNCQKELNDVFKGAKGYGYNYAPLDKVYDEVRPKMTKHGLSLTHEKSFKRDDNSINITSMLMHESGQWIEYNASIPFSAMKQMNDYQASGSGFTYLERYQTSAIFAITADEDSDAQGEQEQQKMNPPSKATESDKKKAWHDFSSICHTMGVEAMDFISSQVDPTDKNAVYGVVRKWLSNEQMLKDQLLTFRQGA